MTRRYKGAAFKIIGAYYSHPRGSLGPSPTDLEAAFSDFLYIISGPGDGSVVLALRAYWLRGGKFETVELTIVGRV